MPKKQTQSLSLFEPVAPPEAAPVEKLSTVTVIKDACPRCGGKSLRTARSYDHNGHTHYCVSGCMSEDRYDAYYFTPREETFVEQVEKIEAKKAAREAIENEIPPVTSDENESAAKDVGLVPPRTPTAGGLPEISEGERPCQAPPPPSPVEWPVNPYYEKNGIVILHGDNREILPQLGIFDLILTDPPYGVGLEYSRWKDTQSNLRELIKTSFPLIRRSAPVVLLTPGNGNQYKYPEPDWTLAWVVPAAVTRGAWGFCSWQPVLAYGKDPYLREGDGARPDIIICNEASDVNGHPCPKPNTVWKWLVKRGGVAFNRSDS